MWVSLCLGEIGGELEGVGCPGVEGATRTKESMGSGEVRLCKGRGAGERCCSCE